MSVERKWLFGGGAGAVLLMLLGYVLIVGPQKANTSSVNNQTASVNTQNLKLRSDNLLLKQQNDNLKSYESTLDAQQSALPASADITSFLRQLTEAATASGVTINSTSVSAPVAKVGTDAGSAYGVPISATAVGTVDNLQKLLKQLQTIQPRAVLITQAQIGTTGDSSDDKATLSLTLDIFALPTTVAGAPTSASAATATQGTP